MNSLSVTVSPWPMTKRIYRAYQEGGENIEMASRKASYKLRYLTQLDESIMIYSWKKLTWGALWQKSSSVRVARVAPSILKLSNGTDGNCSCLLAHCTQAATSAALQRRGSANK